MTTRKRITCRLCGWSKVLWRSNGNGEARNGWNAMRHHWADNHRDEFAALQTELDEHAEAKGAMEEWV